MIKKAAYGDDAHGYAAESGAADDHRLAPVGEVLLKGALVKEAAHPALGGLETRQHVPRVVRRLRTHTGRTGVTF
jgi:hypothetical protein